MIRPFALGALLVLAAPLPVAAQDHRLSGFWGPDMGKVADDPGLIAKLPPDTVVIRDTGVAEFGVDEFGGLKLTPQAREAARKWKPTDDMTLTRACAVQSIVYSVQGPFPFEIDETRDLIVFRYEYFDQIRLIWMDGRGHPPADAPHTKMGHSIGHWEGDELVIDTTHLAPSTITNNGLNHSADIHMVERYKLSPDGNTLMATEWFEDKAVLENNGARFIQWKKKPGSHILPYECDPSFALEYQTPGKPAEK